MVGALLLSESRIFTDLADITEMIFVQRTKILILVILDILKNPGTDDKEQKTSKRNFLTTLSSLQQHHAFPSIRADDADHIFLIVVYFQQYIVGDFEVFHAGYIQDFQVAPDALQVFGRFFAEEFIF